MAQFEYKALVFTIERQGFLSQKIVPDCISDIERKLNSLGEQGWKLTSVFPFTNGGSPAEIEQAIHYFRRELTADTDEADRNESASHSRS